MRDAAYYRAWRAAHPEYRKRQADLRRDRRRERGRESRTEEYARRPSRAVPSLPPIYPQIHRGAGIAFWREELALDLEQERELALLEGRDPDQAVAAYRARETDWAAHIAPLYLHP